MTETNTKVVKKPSDYLILGYQTILPKMNENEPVRIIALVNDKVINSCKIREDLMSKEFPSIWNESKENHNKTVLVSGFYREWSRNGIKTKKAR